MIENVGVDRQSLGENLRRLRSTQKLSQRELAASAEISLPALRNVENCKSTPKLETLQALASALNTTIFELLRPVRIPKKVRFRAKKVLRTRNEILSDVSRWLEDFQELESLLGKTNEALPLSRIDENVAFNLLARGKSKEGSNTFTSGVADRS